MRMTHRNFAHSTETLHILSVLGLIGDPQKLGTFYLS